MVRRFASVDYPVRGLLVLAEIHSADGWGDALLADLTLMLSQRYVPATWGLSIAAHVTEETALPYEISIVRRPAYEDTRILAVGPEALDTWDLLTERRIVADR